MIRKASPFLAVAALLTTFAPLEPGPTARRATAPAAPAATDPMPYVIGLKFGPAREKILEAALPGVPRLVVIDALTGDVIVMPDPTIYDPWDVTGQLPKKGEPIGEKVTLWIAEPRKLMDLMRRLLPFLTSKAGKELIRELSREEDLAEKQMALRDLERGIAALARLGRGDAGDELRAIAAEVRRELAVERARRRDGRRRDGGREDARGPRELEELRREIEDLRNEARELVERLRRQRGR